MPCSTRVPSLGYTSSFYTAKKVQDPNVFVRKQETPFEFPQKIQEEARNTSTSEEEEAQDQRRQFEKEDPEPVAEKAPSVNQARKGHIPAG